MRLLENYVFNRILTAAMSVFGAMLVIVVLLDMVPGDPATALLGPLATPEYAQRFIVEMGLDQPIPVRLWRFFTQVAMGNLGTDVISGRSVNAIVWAALPHTFALAFAAMGLACLIGIPAGVYGAVHRGSVGDTLMAMISVVFVSVPSFILGIFLLVVFSVWLNWLPVLGVSDNASLADQLVRMILPTVALALGWIGLIARLVRTSMLEALGQNYIRTARAYGLRENLVHYKYALKNAVIPTLAIIGMGFGRMLGGAVLIEIIFARQGLGSVLYDALQARNFSVLQGAVFVVVVIFVVVNLLTELSYSLFDPRIQHNRR
ncbi:ABC transporter permease [Devosia faecipullorum]|uniref:ABC transporter permease n=1 Tax=Devosia faecipullorum TaxID=2755039 RepID=UPI00187B4637|nr:ABC transporter permease [Devosia faecipullorum]MBE7732844.1 ABC transporter permease [Devosia faecipullorum]